MSERIRASTKRTSTSWVDHGIRLTPDATKGSKAPKGALQALNEAVARADSQYKPSKAQVSNNGYSYVGNSHTA